MRYETHYQQFNAFTPLSDITSWLNTMGNDRWFCAAMIGGYRDGYVVIVQREVL